MRYALLVSLTSAVATAGPTTRPKAIAPADAPVVPTVGSVVDQRRPAFVPNFLAMTGPTPLEVERDYAYRLSPPTFNYGGAYYSSGYWCPGGFGYVSNHGFYR